MYDNGLRNYVLAALEAPLAPAGVRAIVWSWPEAGWVHGFWLAASSGIPSETAALAADLEVDGEHIASDGSIVQHLPGAIVSGNDSHRFPLRMLVRAGDKWRIEIVNSHALSAISPRFMFNLRTTE